MQKFFFHKDFILYLDPDLPSVRCYFWIRLRIITDADPQHWLSNISLAPPIIIQYPARFFPPPESPPAQSGFLGVPH